MQDTSIAIEYSNMLSDHIHAVRAYDSHQSLAKVNKIVAILLASFGIWAVYMVGLQWWTVIWFIIAPAEWFDLISIRHLQVFLQFRNSPKYREKYRVEFSDSGIHLITPTIDSHIDWTHYNQVIETKRVFVLIYGKAMYSVIPKSAFADNDEIASFRDMLRRHIP